MCQSHAMLILVVLLTACADIQPVPISSDHLQMETTVSAVPEIIPDVRHDMPLPPPPIVAKAATYSVVVSNVSAQEVLFALARDAAINLDIRAGIEGTVTLNALNQTLPQILARIAKQVDMRYELDHDTLLIMADTPYLKFYVVDYVDMTRDAEGLMSNSSQVGSANAAMAGNNPSGSNSQISIRNSLKNHFWERLEKNLADLLRETDKILPEGSSETSVQQSKASSSSGTGAPLPSGNKRNTPKIGLENSPNPVNLEEGGITITKRSTFREAASVITNPESGWIAVRATARQHERVQEFIQQVMRSVHRQVLIEATIAEVNLNHGYQQGINWSKLLETGASKGLTLNQSAAGNPMPPATPNASLFTMGYLNPTSRWGNLSASVALLETFGDVKVLSSPKLSVINNQTAMLRVVDNLVYFTIQANTTSNQTTATTTYTTTPITVPTGFTLSVTPQISEDGQVLLNIRPSITKLLGYVNDPNPALANPCGVGVANCTTAPITSLIPQLQTREMESMMIVEDGQIAVLGGLMQDAINRRTDSVPILSDTPWFGELFRDRNNTVSKTELVIFIRTTVVKNTRVDSEYRKLRGALPDANFLTATPR